jgi:hypothetical protein
MDLFQLIDKLAAYFPDMVTPDIKIRDFVVKGQIEPFMKVRDQILICNAIIKASEDGLEPELFDRMVPGALKSLSELEEIERRLDNAN